MRYTAGRAFKREKLGQSAEPRRSPDQSHGLRAVRATRRLRPGLCHAFVGYPNIPDACQHIAIPESTAAPPARFVQWLTSTKPVSLQSDDVA